MLKNLMAVLMALSFIGFVGGCGGGEPTTVEDTSPAPTPENDPGQAEAAGMATE